MAGEIAASLWTALIDAGRLADQCLHGADGEVGLRRLQEVSWLGHRRAGLGGRSVLVLVRSQVAAAVAAIELDGFARRIVLCPPGAATEHLPVVAAATEADAVLLDHGAPSPAGLAAERFELGGRAAAPLVGGRAPERRTEWVLLTSGTTGPPKSVLHTLATLTAAIRSERAVGEDRVWSTFYDIRRYGGLQVLLRALLGGQSIVLSDAGEAVDDFLHRTAERGVTHISGTPSHWRRALMSPGAAGFAPRYVRLSGEIADQGVLDWLRAEFPAAGIAHAFASTEAGVAFTVADGRAGFPANLLEQSESGVRLQVRERSLRIRSGGMAHRYLGEGAPEIVDGEGFVDTGDLIERQGERCFFIGRRDGIINVGGQKVHPEEVETVINRHPRVQLSLAKARRNPVIGAVVVADVQLRPILDAAAGAGGEAVRIEILEACRRLLAPHKVPVSLRFVPSLEVSVAGKLIRPSNGRVTQP